MGRRRIFTASRDPRLVTVRRGGTLQDADHRLLALRAAACARHVLHLFEQAQPADDRPRRAIEQARAWVWGEVTMTQARTAAFAATPRPERCPAPPGKRLTPPVKPWRWLTSRRTNSVRRPTRSGPPARLLPKGSARRLVAGSAGGSAPSFPVRSGTSCSTTRGGAMRPAGPSLIADRPARATVTTRPAHPADRPRCSGFRGS